MHLLVINAWDLGRLGRAVKSYVTFLTISKRKGGWSFYFSFRLILT